MKRRVATVEHLVGALLLHLGLLLYPYSSAQAGDVTGSWQFDGNLEAAVGLDGTFDGSAGTTAGEFGTCSSFDVPLVDGADEQIYYYSFATGSPGDAIRFLTNAAENGGGSRLNQYSLVLDILHPDHSGWGSVFHGNANGNWDGDLWFQSGAGNMGDYGDYGISGPAVNTWHRVVVTVDLTLAADQMQIHVDGVPHNSISHAAYTVDNPGAGAIHLPTGSDPGVYLFTDDGTTQRNGYINNFQIRDYAMSAAEIAALGPPAAGAIAEPGGVVAEEAETRFLASFPGDAGARQVAARLTNLGGSAHSLSYDLSGDAGFSLGDAPESIDVAATADVTVLFNPPATGTFTATLTITTDEPQTSEFTLTAVVTGKPVIVGLWEFNDAGDITSASLGGELTLEGAGEITAQAGVPGFAADTGSVRAPDNAWLGVDPNLHANGGGNRANQFTLMMDFSPSQVSASWNRLVKGGGGSYYQNQDRVGIWMASANQIWSPSGSLATGEWYRLVYVVDTVNDRFDAFLDGALVATGGAGGVDGPASLDPEALTILGDSSVYQEETSCSLFAVYNRPLSRAYVAANLAVAGETIPVTSEPEAVLSATSLAFSDAGAPGIPSTSTLTILNTGNEELIYSLSFTGDPVFSALTEPAPIAPGNSQDVQLQFAPTSRVSFGGTLVIASNDWSSPTFEVQLSGTGVEPRPYIQLAPAAGDLVLPPVFVPGGRSTTRQVTVTNSGFAPLTWASELTGDAAFSVVNTPRPSLEPGDDEIVAIEFAPDASGDFTAELRITTNVVETPEIVLGLSGRALDPASGPVPALRPDLALWVRADAGTDSTGSGSVVTTWADQSANAIDLAGGDATHIMDPATGLSFLRMAGVAPFRGSLDQTLSNATIFTIGNLLEPSQTSAAYYWYCFGRRNGAASQYVLARDDGAGTLDAFYHYDGSGVHKGIEIPANRFHYFTQVYDGSADSTHQGFLDGVDSQAGGPSTPYSSDWSQMSIGSWINSSGGSSNVLNGDVAEIIVYDRALTAEEIADVEEYLRSRLPETVPAGPVEPVRLYALLDGGANAAHGWLPDGDPNASGSAVMTIRPGENAMDFNIVMETAFDVSQAHFYAIPGGAEAANLGDSDICWGNRWSNHDLLVGENYVNPRLTQVSRRPDRWFLMMHTSGGYFALDGDGFLVPFDPDVHAAAAPRVNNRTGRLVEAGMLDPNGTPYPTDVLYLFLLYDDQGPSADYGGPGGAIGGVLSTVPEARCRDVTVAAGTDCEAAVAPELVYTGFTHPEVALTLALDPAGPFPLGSTEVTVTVTDDLGNADSCAAMITVEDRTPPQITCPAAVSVECTELAGATVDFAAAATDSCDTSPMVTAEPASGSLFPVGTTTVTVTAVDSAGNTESCTFDVTVTCGAQFVRGDANGDGGIDISDPTHTLRYLFLGGRDSTCADAADANDDGSVTLADVIYSLNYSFRGDSAPPTPFPDCGLDGTADELGCLAATAGCE
ncbi:MAG: choice-of-anchor D domain-containing protein [Planctomycetota bacterium]|nr:choice-of-anchor D domain-containing protein [Planctomycetota bacterium]